MNGGVIGRMDTVSIPRDQLGAFLDAVRQVRTGFLICAPHFAAGSRGEQMVAIAAELGKTLEAFYAQLDEKPEKSDKTDPATAK